jgi:hypothetical protein
MTSISPSDQEDELTKYWNKSKLKMWSGSWSLADKSFRRCLPLSAARFGKDSFVCAAIYLDLAECKFSLSEAMPKREDAEELCAAGWACVQAGLLVLRSRCANGSFTDPRLAQPAEIAFRQQDLVHSISYRQPGVLRRPQDMQALTSGASFWAYSMFIKCALLASHRFITHISSLRFPAFATLEEAETCRQLLLEGLKVLGTSRACPFVCTEEVKLCGHMPHFFERAEQIAKEFFGGNGRKLGELQDAFLESTPALAMRGVLDMNSLKEKRGSDGRRSGSGVDRSDSRLKEHDRFFQENAEAERRRQSAAGGLKPCSLATCGLLEDLVGQHKLCSRCRTARYCCAEHQRADWKAHKLSCSPK